MSDISPTQPPTRLCRFPDLDIAITAGLGEESYPAGGDYIELRLHLKP
jgi:hypothetical protein